MRNTKTKNITHLCLNKILYTSININIICSTGRPCMNVMSTTLYLFIENLVSNVKLQ